MTIDKTRAERLVSAAMALLPYDCGDDMNIDYGITIRASAETVEALKQSDSPFAGYVISSIIDDPTEAGTQYDDWVSRTVRRSLESLADPVAATHSMEEVIHHMDQRMSARKEVMSRLRETFTTAEIEMLGIIMHGDDLT